MVRNVIAVVLALGIVYTLSFAFVNERIPSKPAIDISKAVLADVAKINERTILAFQERGDVVSYAYMDSPLPSTLAEAEVPELRTPNSHTVLLAVDESKPDPILALKSTFFTAPKYVVDEAGVWHGVQYATTTQEAWHARHITFAERILDLIGIPVFADTGTYYTFSGDGSSWGDSAGQGTAVSAWNNRVNSSDDPTTTAFNVSSEVYICGAEPTEFCAINPRAFFPFDTSSLSSSASISAATFSVYVTAINFSDNDGFDYITVVRTAQSTHTTLSGSWSTSGGTEGIDTGQRKDISSSISANATLSFTLNSTGIGWIAKSGQASNCSATAGVTCLGLREGHDFENNRPGTDLGTTGIVGHTSENTNVPQLDVTYTITASQAVQSGMKVGAFGSLKVTGGGIKIQ